MQLSEETLEQQFCRFEAQVLAKSKQPFTSFREGLPGEWENYKELLRNEALRRLNFSKWKRSDVGTGRILKHVIHAIEINDKSPRLRNNLVDWQNIHGEQDSYGGS